MPPQSPLPISAGVSVGWGRRIASLVGFVLVFLVANYTFYSTFVLAEAVLLFSGTLENLFPHIAVELVSVLLGLVCAWVAGRYWRWTIRGSRKIRAPHHFFTKIVFWLFCFFVLVLFGLSLIPAIGGLMYRDIPSVNDKDLQLSVLSVPDNQNALADLMSAAKMFDDGSSTEALADYTSAAQKPLFQDLSYANPDTMSVAAVLPPLGTFRAIAKLNDSNALDLAQQGKGSEALSEVMTGLVLGEKLQQSRPRLIQWLVGVSIKENSLTTIQTVLASTSIPSKNLIAFADQLKGQEDDTSGLIEAFKSEYHEFKNLYGWIAHGDVNAATSSLPINLPELSSIDRTNFYFHPNETISYFADTARHRIMLAQASCTTQVSPDNVQKLAPENPLLWYITPDAMGKVLHDIVMTSLDSVKAKQCHEQMLLSATRVLVALKAYKQDNKHLPDSLDALIPKYLSDMPLDPFSGQSFAYSTTTKALSSAGSDKTTFFPINF